MHNAQPGSIIDKVDIDGPGQPEMSSFKSVGAGNLVNLFSGDFSYNIPLMDVGGYPVNIYYDGGVSPEQEASWVGLGWNINPGNINRSTRGIPDDFNGSDTMIQEQRVRVNKTWGLSLGADIELLGRKKSVVSDSTTNFNIKAGASLGVAFNNQLGPALDISIRGNGSYNAAKLAGSEKFGASTSVNLGIDINSRSGTSFTWGASLGSNTTMKNLGLSVGVGVSTGYNSRTGIKGLQLYGQTSFSGTEVKKENKEIPGGSRSVSLWSTGISFVKPSYTPSLRLPITNTAWSGRFQLGIGLYGVATDLEAELYGQKSEIKEKDRVLKKPMVGYLYYQNAVKNANAVMDFTRFNDREVTPNTPVISVPQYTYDVFSIQGEGTGGSVRAYRNDLGYVRDNLTISKSDNLSVGADVDPPAHYGANVSEVNTPSAVSEWNLNNGLRNVLKFRGSSGGFESVYFRNPGENAVIDASRYTQIGGVDLVRFKLSGSDRTPVLEPKLESFGKDLRPVISSIDLAAQPVQPSRNKRTQVVSFLTAEEAAVVGLDKFIKSYNNTAFLDNIADTLVYEKIARVGEYRKGHHISQINVTEGNGKRYIYGVPVYNIVQKDFTFSVNNTYSNNAYADMPDKIKADSNQRKLSSALLDDQSTRDGYVQVSTTPAHAHSFLLSGILSPDYVDVNGDGITEDDLGTAVKFNYSRIKDGTEYKHKWRTPHTAGDSAIFNAGLRSEDKDDKAMISYGERESWYLQSVESKTMIALFHVSDRKDGKGAVSIAGGINAGEKLIKELDSITLYNKADLKKNGLALAKPIQTVHFKYSYKLCQHTPDNSETTAGMQGKLTLDSIYTTYNGKNRGNKNMYRFVYAYRTGNNPADNPDYSYGSSDRWGVYKPWQQNPLALKNTDYPYSLQSADSSVINDNASAWMLKKIKLPSGGELQVNYESDDYAFVQNKRAARMMRVIGFGSSPDYSNATDRLYSQHPFSIQENDYVFIRVPEACANTSEVFAKYLQGLNQLAFKVWVKMPKGAEYLPCYGEIESNQYGVTSTSSKIIWVKLKRLAGMNPIAITALEYLRQQLPGQAYTGYDVSDENGLDQVADILVGMFKSLKDAFKDPVAALRRDSKAKYADTSYSLVRLNNPTGFKYGGGHRVKSVLINDNWSKLTGQYTSTYGQVYDYTTTENFNGSIRKISSGVASYEPSIGGEENPFQSIISVEDYLPLGPTSYGAVEMPVMDAFFPSPSVGYSKVTVTSLKRGNTVDSIYRSGVGKQVTEFYTAKDFPVYYSYTPMDAASTKTYHAASNSSFNFKYSYDFKAQTQGFLIVNNDMHGKMKSQASYAESDSSSMINYTENIYRNTGVNGLDDKFTFITKTGNGAKSDGNMGVDVELMTDTREFSVRANSKEYQGQVDIFMFTIPIPIGTLFRIDGMTDNTYRSVTTTKVVNYHAVLDSVVVIDKGSFVGTKNLAYDAETGEVLVTRTNNEFNKPVYNVSYPAHWAYSGMGLAYKNIDAVFSGVNFSDGKPVNLGADTLLFESGDELLVKKSSIPQSGCDLSIASGSVARIWAYDKYRNQTPLETSRDLVFIDSAGKPFTMADVSVRVIRSGHRNMLDAKVAQVTTMGNPLKLSTMYIDSTTGPVNASAVEFKEKWQTDNDVIRHVKLVIDPVTCVATEVEDTAGYMEKHINPYVKGLLGTYRGYRSMVFYDGRKEYDTASLTNIPVYGLLKNFNLYWKFNGSSQFMPDTLSSQWVWNSRLNKVNAKGLELETLDALGIYTAAQYGYGKTMPVAIANNARANEVFAENFEDYFYGETISNARFNNAKRHIDFLNTGSSYLAKMDSTGISAHSGKYAFAVNAGGTAVKPLTMANSIAENFQLAFGRDTVKQLTLTGGNLTKISAIPATAPAIAPTFSTGNLGMSLDFSPTDVIGQVSGNSVQYYLKYKSVQYTQISTPATYNFNLSTSQGYAPLGNDTPVIIFNRSAISFTIKKLNGDVVASYDCYSNSSPLSVSLFLTCDIYMIECLCSADLQRVYNTNDGFHMFQAHFGYSSNTNTVSYRSPYPSNMCFYTTPIPSNEQMLNPLFSVSEGKKMFFSAWVRERCGNPANGVSCKEYTYTHNQVQVKYSNFPASTVSISPGGPIIDGWQRYEGVFTVPAGAGNVTLNFINTSGSPVYFDDVRIHPFNSNVKSYVYDPVNLRLLAELDANNYGSYYEYDGEGILIRTKAETKEGVKTITETRSSLQKIIK
ncbi:MAG: hypothetical protein HZA79_16990 [Sphingobacteriales bacterium]|nr:hypothetical protein [Sphingobacteriales bacterium]